MKKSELITKVAVESNLSKKDAEAAVNAFINVVRNELVDGNDVTVSGLGTFRVRERAARTGRNPQTGQSLRIPAHNVVVFKAAKQLKLGVR